MENLNLIALDLDGVWADSYVNIRRFVKERHNLDITNDDINSWDYIENRFGREESLRIYKEMWVDWASVPPMEPNATKYVRELTELANVFVVTIRQGSDDIASVTKWIAREDVPITGILAMNILSKINKVTFAPPFKIFIDDSPHTAMELAHNGFKVYLRDQPWNRTLPPEIERKIIRIKSLKEVVNQLKLDSTLREGMKA